MVVLVDDSYARATSSESITLLEQEGLRSALVLPLIADKTLIGLDPFQLL